MKSFRLASLIALASIALSVASLKADAQTYPYSSPVYTPTAILAPSTLAAPGTFTPFVVSGVATVSVRITGTCTALAATLQGSNDGTNFTAINLYPIATGTSAPTAVASVSAVGFWKANVTGFTSVKLVASALTATCTVAMAGTAGAFNGTQF
jgi:hypothetical protein